MGKVTDPDSGILEVAGFAQPSVEAEFLHNVRNCIMDRIDDPDLHVNDLCRALCLSHSQLHRKLTALTGMPANRFIRNVRLHEAAVLLRDPERSVSDVAFDTGFRDPDYFGRAFRKHFGMTPTEYRTH